jgi:Spy/CpxP family protein refolding chaperone
MTTLRKHVLVALAVLGMGGAGVAVQAQTAPPEGRHANAVTQEQRMAKMDEHFAKRQAKLHDALHLTPAQEPAWATYQAALKPGAMMGAHGDRASWAALSAPARMEKMIALSKQHTALMETRLAALNTFYALLTPAQKQVFDKNTLGGDEHHRGEHMKHPMTH